MSTKIYDGMIAVNASQNLFKLAEQIRETIEPIFFDKFHAARKLAESREEETWLKVFYPFPKTISGGRYEKWNGKIADSRNRNSDLYELIGVLKSDPQHTFSDLDFGYDVVLLPNGRGVTAPALALLFSERAGDEYRKALFDAEVLRDYGYWDNTDEPDHVSETEWKQRKKAWSKLDVPAADGLMIHHPDRITTIIEMYDR